MITPSEVYVAGNRFGLGLRPGEAAEIADDPRGWLLAQLDSIHRLPAALRDLPASADLLQAAAAERMDMQRMRRDPGTEAEVQDAQQDLRRQRARGQQAQQLMRLQAAVRTDQPFAERLVHFWSNHFTIAVSGGPKEILREIALPYEQEAIRNNLDKDFATLLLAVEQHPAMLIYLDNAASVGPGSVAGRRRERGLNENLAREILELHTLGVDGGYTQEDITGLARIITGWTAMDPANARLPGLTPHQQTGFTFVAALHEPGTHRLLGKTYRQDGVAQGEAALYDLARHPSTARHIATKLARHFISDKPPAAAVSRLENTFLDTGGDLPSLHAALVDLDAAWEPDNRKLRTPQDLVTAAARALDLGNALGSRPRVNGLLSRILATFNQMPFTALSPAGWPDVAAYWGGADALMKRMEWASALSGLAPRVDALSLAEAVLAPDAFLARELELADSPQQAITLLLASPVFQWR